MKCSCCHKETSDDYFVIDYKRVIDGDLMLCPSTVICPECYKILRENFKRLENYVR